MRIFLMLASLCLLQSCLLDYFFAPKIAIEALPFEPETVGLKNSYVNTCGKCHLLIDPQYYDAEHPIERFTLRYRENKIINQREASQIETYIRTLANRN